MKTLLLRLSSRFSIPPAAMATALLLALAGCTTPEPVVSAAPAVDRPARAVRDADELFQRGRATEAILACIEIARKDPLAPGLADLQSRILNRLNEQRRASITARAAASQEAMAQDARRQGLVPDTYGVSRHIIGDISSHNSPRTKMQQALTNEISMHLEDADLAGIITELGDAGINLVSDSDISGKTLTIHTENTPLRELLEFIGRNLDVSFNVGETLIWVTSRLPTDGPIPLETRVYRLRIGLPGNEVPGGAALGEAAQTGSGEIAIVDAIKKFVPQPAGSEISFDTRAHALLVKNKREYLTETENIINALDVRPLQVLIEARFINTKANDTRALGIDWLLAGPMSSPFANKLVVPDGSSIAKTTDGKSLTKTISADDLTLTGSSLGAGLLQNGAGSLLYSGVLDDIRLKAVLQAMESSGQTRTLTVPRITTVNNRTATIHIGEEFQYYDNLTAPVNQNLNNTYNNPFGQSSTLLTAVTAWQAQITGYGAPEKWDTVTSNLVTQLRTMIANANNQILTQGAQSNNPLFTGTPKTISLGYNLSVTPSVGADLATINLALIPDITELQNKSEWEAANTPGKATFQTLGMLPIVMQKKIETEMVVRSGETVVMGGLAQASGGKDRTGIPWLSHIPLLGWLFRTDSTNEGADNLLVFVTATLISDMGENLIPLTPRAGPGTEVPPAALSESLGIEDRPLE
jgi:type II secretory pathway component GspD/PulD (secretin)